MNDSAKADLARVAEIDAMFEDASGWGSWMVECANEREAIVNRLHRNGMPIGHKWRARTSDGQRVS